MRQIDTRLFVWLYKRSPRIGTLYYAVRQPILILFCMFMELLLAIPLGIVDGIVAALGSSGQYLLEAVRSAAFRFGRYASTIKVLNEGGAK